MRETDPQYVDLHGYREEEIEDVFDDISIMITTEFTRGNSKIATRRVGNNVFCVVKAMTGKGRHSKCNKNPYFRWKKYLEAGCP